MKISGFSMVKNADKLYYPVKEMILSALPLVDEFIIAIGDCDKDDKTRELVESIDSSKIEIIDTVWDIEKYPRGMENAHQTDIAKSHCKGDWLLYLQADEAIHEDDIPAIRKVCQKYLKEKDADGFLFQYHHFWGDYNHHHFSHAWYKREIRIIRNDSEIHSWESAQSFRRIPDFDGTNYRQQQGTIKLNVVEISARIYHYGWVRPPELMQKKTKALDTIHKGSDRVKELEKSNYYTFDYGPLNRVKRFKGSHPSAMRSWIERFNWDDRLQYSGKVPAHRKKHKHERLKYRILTFIENTFLNGKTLGGFKNFKILKKEL